MLGAAKAQLSCCNYALPARDAMHFVGLTERGSNARSPPPVEKNILVIARLTPRTS